MLSTLGSWRKHLLKYKLKQIKALEYLEYFSTIIRQELKKKNESLRRATTCMKLKINYAEWKKPEKKKDYIFVSIYVKF